MMHVFVSDVHIGAFSAETEKKTKQDFLSLIGYCEKNHLQLHILGDLFDYWMEYPGFTPHLGKEILDRLESFNKLNGGATLITGNHDNWTLGHFKKRGFNVHHEYADLTLGNRRIFMHHGDGLTDSRFHLSRPFFHRLLRNRWFTKLYQSIFPAKTGLLLMKLFSSFSRRRTHINPDRLNTWSETFLKENLYDVVLSGHDHVPRMETFSFGTYINLGTFFEHRSLAIYTNEEFRLVTWDGATNEFQPAGNIKTG